MVRHVNPRTALLAMLALLAALTVGLPGPAEAALCTETPEVGFSDDGVEAEEGDSGTTTFTFTVTLGCEPAEEVVVEYETVDVTATGIDDPETEQGDYARVESGEVTFDALTDQDADIDITVYGDSDIEPDETFEVRLVDVTSTSTVDSQPNATIDDESDTAVGTILNDDLQVSVEPAASATEGDPVGFTVSLTDANDDPVTHHPPVTIAYHTENGDADGDDYTGTEDGSVTIADGETTTDITVPTTQDTEPEPDETFTVVLDSATNAIVNDDASVATGTILDDDPRVSIDDVSVVEGHSGTTDAVFPVTIDPPPAQEVSIDYQTVDDTAEDESGDGDYQSASGSLTFEAGETTRTITVKVNGDFEVEGDEHFEVELTGISDASIAYLPPDGLSATGTIVADDGEPIVTIGDGSTLEGDEGQTPPIAFPITLDQPSGGDIVLDYTTADGSEDEPETPEATDGFNDANGEPDPDEDTDYEAAGTREPTQEEVDGGCSEDEEQPANSITIPAGTTETTLTVDVIGDGTHEPDEVFTVVLAQPCEGNNPPVSLEGEGADDTATGTILNDDDRPTVTADDTSVDEGDAFSRFAEFDVHLSHPSSSCVQVDFVTTDGTATVADGDYEKASGVLVFSPGSLSPDESASDHGCDDDSAPPVVEVFGDEEVEASETFDLELFNATGAVFPDDADRFVATGTIVNDDGPEVSIGDTEVAEGDSGTTDAVLRLTTPASAHDGFSVNYATVDGGATAGTDYEATSGTVTFAPGAESATVKVPVIGDTEDEDDETFTVELSNPDRAVIVDGQGQVTIIDDDEPAGGGDGGGSGGDGGDQNGQPTVDAGGDRSAEVGDLLTFAASGSDPDGDPLTYRWDFGDGTTATGEQVDHRWDTDGTYAVTVTADDGNGGQASAKLAVRIGPDSGEVGRSAGGDRVATALAVAADHWGATASSSGDVQAPEGPHAVLATAGTFPDALAGGALAALLEAPLLLTFPDQLEPRVLDELDRRDVRRVWVLGGHAAISPQVEIELTDAGYEVIRYAGSDRFETAAQIARGVGPSLAGEVIVALGSHADPNRAWPDALSAGALTATPDPPPVLLTAGDHLPDVTVQALTELDASKVFLMGGTAAVSGQVEQHLADLGLEVERVAGADRYATSVAAATVALGRHSTGELPTVFATGSNFPDGLAAGALAAHLDGLLLLVPGAHLADATAAFLTEHAYGLDTGVVVGGEFVVSEDVRTTAASAMRAP